MIPEWRSRRPGPVMWGAIGVMFLVLAIVIGFRLDPRITGFAAAALVSVCLVVCGATLWLDSRAVKERARLTIQVRSGPAPTGRPVQRPVR